MSRRHLLALPLLLAPLLAGCGNAITAQIVGMAAVTVDTDGTAVVLVRACTDDVDTIEVVGSRAGLSQEQPNPLVASWRTRDPQAGTVSLPVDRPPAGWSAGRPGGAVTFAPDRRYIVLALASRADAEVTQVDFRGSDLTALDDGHVLVRNSRLWTRQRFDRQSCDDLSST